MNRDFLFDRVFGKKWHERFDGLFSLILGSMLLCAATLVTVIANLDYQILSQRANQLIHKKYKERIAQFIINEREDQFADVDGIYLEKQPGLNPDTEIINQPASTNRSRWPRRISANTGLSALPEIDEEEYLADIESANHWVELNQPIRSSGRKGRNAIERPFDYMLERRGSFYLSIPEDMIPNVEEESGYRDPDEITRVIEEYQPMIQYCFYREARHFTQLRGFIKVQFDISYEGYVVPGSIRIMNSTLRNREIEQCIKKFIQRWKNFERLDESMGIAKVKQKFIFN